MTYYIDLFYFKKNKIWMFKLMGAYTFNKSLISSSGLKFIKLFGTGSNEGFSLIPDFSSYVIISSWKNDHYRKKFIDENNIINEIISRSSKRVEIKIDPYNFTGSWNGINPFKDTWIRLNYEPRKNSRTYIYQTIGFQEKIKPSSTTKISNRKKNYNIYQKNCNSKYQFCDLNLVKIRKIPLLQPTTRLTFESGWIK